MVAVRILKSPFSIPAPINTSISGVNKLEISSRADPKTPFFLPSDFSEDVLPCGSNEEQLQDIEDHAQDYDNAALIFMDVDGLKNTNDLYGHNAGDELIISAALCIKNVFATYGKCYRIGGDEFCVLIFDSIENMDELLKQMDQEIIKYNRNNRYYLSIARGVSFLKDIEGKQKKISDWKYEADQDMYCNKKRRNINDRL